MNMRIFSDFFSACFSDVHIYFKRIDIKDVPDKKHEVKRFLVRRLAMKER